VLKLMYTRSACATPANKQTAIVLLAMYFI
jgi:hypothetical protein